MSDINDAWAAQQRRRWMRPNAHLYVRPDAWRFMPAGALRYLGKEAVRYFWPEHDADSAAAPFEVKYRPDQPRVPAGNSDGGQWTGGPARSISRATDFSSVRRGRGHHFVNQSLYRDLQLRPETRRVFDDATTGPLHGQRHGWSRDHDRYNQGVAEHFDRYLRSNEIRPEEMTPDQARPFVQEIRSSNDPRIRDFNMRILRQELQYYLRRLPRTHD